MLRLYEHPLSPYAQKVKLALSEKHIPFEAVMPNLFGEDPAFAAANPRREGDHFGCGDISVFPYVNGAASIGDRPGAGSAVADWLERVRGRDSAKQVVAAAEASMSVFTEVPKLIESGAWKREYRDHRLEWMLRTGGREIVLDGLAKDNIRFTIEL